MDKYALSLINDCIQHNNTFLNLGYCDLTDAEFEAGGRLDNALSACKHLKTLILSNNWEDWRTKTHIWDECSTKPDFFFQPQFFHKHPFGPNSLSKIPNSISQLEGLETLICGDNLEGWPIKEASVLNCLKNMSYIDLSYNAIGDLSWLRHAPSLKFLCLNGNALQNLKGISDLPLLEEMYVNNNQIKTIKDVCELPNLSKLTIKNNQLSNLDGIERLKSLRKLDVSQNKITSLKKINTLTALEQLFADKNKISTLDGIRNCYDLFALSVKNNKIKTLKGLRPLPKLKYLKISQNRFESITEIGIFDNLEVLDIGKNQITCLSGIEVLQRLENLDVSDNKIAVLDGVEKLVHLTMLNFESNIVQSLTPIEGLLALNKLNANRNRIRKLNGIEHLTGIEELNIGNNEIDSLIRLENLKLTKYLIANNNKISSFLGLENFDDLEELNLSENDISTLESIGIWPSLTKLELSYNRIRDIQPLLPLINRDVVPLGAFTTIDILTTTGVFLGANPLSSPPPHIIDQGYYSIIDYFEALQEDSIINCEVKCIIFGNGGVGKTALSRLLREKLFTTKYEPSHGILIETWEIHQMEFPDNLTQKINNTIRDYREKKLAILRYPKSLQINMWDFGGQEYYHATHRLFMSDNSLYLLLWEEETNSQNDNTGDFPYSYWMKNIRYFSNHSITLNIQNKVKGNCQAVDRDLHFKIEYRNPYNPETFRQFTVDIDQLRNGILNKLASLDHFGASFPRVYDEIRNALMADPRPYITYKDYEQICELRDTTRDKIMRNPSQKQTLLNSLDSKGAVVCFRFRKNIHTGILKSFVFNNPKWLTSVIYEIIEKGKWEFDIEHVKTVTARYLLNTDVWIALMKEFELIFEIIRNKQSYYIVPQYLRKNVPNREAYDMALDGKNIFHAFTLFYPEFLPNSNFLRFISRYGTQNLNFLYWKTGLVFIKHGKTVIARSYQQGEQKKISVHIQDSDPMLTRELFETFIEIDDNEQLEVSVNEKDKVKVQALQIKIVQENLEIDTTTGRTLKMEEFKSLYQSKKTFQSMYTVKIFVSYSNKDRGLRELLVEGLREHLSHKRDIQYELWSDQAIDLGADWKIEIDRALQSSKASILLVSASFASSRFIKDFELAKFLKRKQEEGYLILPVLIRNYDFHEFEEISCLNFFKVFYEEFKIGRIQDQNKILPFDVLAENDNVHDRLRNEYYYNLAAYIHGSVTNFLDRKGF